MIAGEATLRRLLAPIQEMLDYPNTVEVMVQGPHRVGWERDGKLTWHHIDQLDYRTLRAIAVYGATMTDQDISKDRPSCSTALPGNLRTEISIPPMVPPGTVSLTIRKRAANFCPTLEWLNDRGYFSELDAGVDWPAFFSDAMQKQRTVLVCGRIASSKTTFAEALIRAIPLECRIVTIEDTPEWAGLPHPGWDRLYYSKGNQGRAKLIGAAACLEAAVRKRADWILMQELRDSAAHTYLRALATGHPGITTCHANDVKLAFNALALMIPPEMCPPDAVRGMLDQYVDIVVHCAKAPYRITEVWDRRA
jgi:type IV secretion system protein VirB11